ncbi:MAG: prepilin-type N-terminal cleavage/methylation domain-containing protein, partial [Oscillospiraceae bacterium]
MKKQKQRGFTLIETLVVVGLVVVLLGIAIPSVVAIQRDLQMSELDDTARQIALSVQNRLTTLKATGELDAFGKDMATSGHPITTKPVDYALEDEQWRQLYYLESDKDATLIKQYLMGEGSVLGGYVENGSFILELSPDTGDVYGVFYATHPIVHTTDVEETL